MITAIKRIDSILAEELDFLTKGRRTLVTQRLATELSLEQIILPDNAHSKDEIYLEYKKDSVILTDMFRCATRYLSYQQREPGTEEQQRNDEQLIDEMLGALRKYEENIRKLCFAETGKYLE